VLSGFSGLLAMNMQTLCTPLKCWGFLTVDMSQQARWIVSSSCAPFWEPRSFQHLSISIFTCSLWAFVLSLRFNIVNKRCSSPKRLHPQHQRLSGSDTNCSFCSLSLTKGHWLSLYYFHACKFNGPDARFRKVLWYFLLVTWKKENRSHFIWGMFPFRIRTVCKYINCVDVPCEL
jgi:hypothetical protein